MAKTASPGPFSNQFEPAKTSNKVNSSSRQNDRRRPHGSILPPIRAHSASTVLQYSDDESSDVTSTTESMSVGKWWNNILPGVTATRTKSPDNAEDEQEVVDEYLEFLSRRYNRLHADEKAEESPKPFSALNWLRQGSSSDGQSNANVNDILQPTERQQSDSLYVLGVAGLASEKLLQKHQMIPKQQQQRTEKATRDVSSKSVKEGDVLEVDYYKVSETSKIGTVLAARVAPIVRRLKYLEHRRQLVIRDAALKLQIAATAVFKTLIKSLIHGPVNAAKAVLEIGGGKKTLAVAFTVAYATVLILRPLLRAAVTEGSVGPGGL